MLERLVLADSRLKDIWRKNEPGMRLDFHIFTNLYRRPTPALILSKT
jgi:hypothetical protein